MKDAVKVIEQKIVLFHDDELVAVRGEDGHIYVSFRHICDSIGINRQTQVRKIREHDVLSDGYKGGVINTPPSASGRGGGPQEASLLRVDLIPMWLTTINASRVRSDIRPKIKAYQREAAKVLWEAFQEGRLSLDSSFSDLLQNDNNPAVQAYKMAQAIMKMAQQQIILEARMDEWGRAISSNTERIEELETKIGAPDRVISAEQAMHISQAVKTIALALGKRSGRNEFGGVYGELYRRFQIPSYRELPAAKFDEAMSFLRQWYGSVTDTADIPF